MSFTSAEINSMIVTLGITMANVIAAWGLMKVNSMAKVVSEVKKQSDGQATAAAARETALYEKLEVLRGVIAEKRETAAVLAQAVSASKAEGIEQERDRNGDHPSP